MADAIIIPEETSFETAVNELEQLLSQMESGALPLEELISCFERGNALSAFCRRKLTNMESRVELLLNANAENEHTEPFNINGSAVSGPRG